MKLNEWNDLIIYGNKICDMLKAKGYDVELMPYTIYDGRKGLSMIVLDAFGDFFKVYYSGIDTPEIMMATMYMNMNRILKEC